MPIRFICSHCGQRLSVPTERADQEVKCPRCRQVVRVPGERPAGVSEPLPGPAVEPPPAPQASAEAMPAVEPVPQASAQAQPVGEPARAVSRPASSALGDRQTISVPRYVVYVQGLLLGVVALVFFVFGMIVGSRSRSASDSPPAQPCVVTGTVLYEDHARQTQPDESSIAIIVPLATRPDQKAAVEGLRPADPEPGETHPGMAVIRSLGGDYARVDRRGRYRLRVTTPGRYYLLIVSQHARRESHEQPQASDLAQIGRYFVPATSLLDNQQYSWQELRVRNDVEFNCQF